MKVLFTGGGTAGHIFPIIAVAREMRRILPQGTFQFFYIGPKDDFGEILLSREGIEVKTILAGKFRRYFGLKSLIQNIVDIFIKAPIGFLQALFYIFVISPDVIFSKGGYGSLSTVVGGWFMLVPIFLHESDIAPGLANRLSGKFCLEIFVSFPIERTEYFSPKKMIYVGNPIRGEVLGGDRENAKKIFNLTNEKPVILILGGSQGSQRINDVLLIILPEILKSFELIHQVGQKNFKEIEAEAKVVIPKKLQECYHIYPFLREEELKDAYAVADLILSRAGAGSIFEISAAGKPSILVPLPESAQNHQYKNAYAYAECGAAQVIEEPNFTPHFFLERLKFIFSNLEILKRMAENAQDFSKPYAARVIAEYLITYLGLAKPR